MRISDWSSDVCSSDLRERLRHYVMAGEHVKPSTLRKGRVTMGKVKRKARARVEFVTAMDATPERLAKGDHSEMVNPAEIDDTEQAIPRVRPFRSSSLGTKNGTTEGTARVGTNMYISVGE